MREQEKLQYCKDCKDNFYNGNNPYGIEKCGHFKNAKVVWKKEVHINQRPPWKQKAIRVLNCFKRPGYIYVDANREY